MQRPALRGLLTLLLLAAFTLATPVARSQEGQVAFLTVFVNESPRGEIPVLVRDTDILVPTSEIETLGLAEIAHGPADSDEYASLAAMAPAVSYRFDEEDLTLRLTVDARRLPATTVNLRRSAPEGIEYPSATCLFLNYAPRLVDMGHVDGHAESGLSVGRTLSWSSASLRRDGKVVRGFSRVEYDDRDELRTWTLGDSFSSAGALGGAVHAGGVSLSRNFDLDPYFVRGPSFDLEATALTPSSLDVYVNGVLVRHDEVDAGPVRIENLPLQSGRGIATYVLRDAFGRTHTQASPFYLSNGVLRKGLSEYTYTLGVKREQIGASSFSYGAPVALARHRLGVRDWLTVGGRLEAGDGVVSSGTTWTSVTKAGLFDLAVGVSGARGDRTGAAGALSWSYQTRQSGLGVSLQRMSEHYATLSLAPEDDRAVFEGNAYASVSLSRSVSIRSRHVLSRFRDAGLFGQMSLSGTFDVGRGASLIATATRTRLPQNQASNELLMTLAVNLDEATSSQVSTRLRSDEDDEMIVSVNRVRPRGKGMGYRATLAYADEALDRAQVEGEAAGAHGVYTARYELEPPRADGRGPRRHHVTLSTQGAIVVLPDVGVFATRPVRGAVGVIRVPGVPGVRGFLNNQQVGRTDGNGNLVVPDVLPYYGNRLGIADEDLPLDYEIETTEMVVGPPSFGAGIAEFDARRVVFYRGTVVVVEDGREIVPAYGELFVKGLGHVSESPIGEKGEMEVEGLAAGTYSARIVYMDGECSFLLELPPGSGPVIDVGRRACIKP